MDLLCSILFQHRRINNGKACSSQMEGAGFCGLKIKNLIVFNNRIIIIREICGVCRDDVLKGTGQNIIRQRISFTPHVVQSKRL